MPTPSTPPRPDQDHGTVPAHDAVQVPGAPGRAAQLLDPDLLRDMRRDFSDPSVVERFARDFCDSLMEKIDRLDGRLQDDDAMGAEDAALSLTTSAAMVGAVRLAQAAGATQRSIRAGSLEDARRSVARLRACGADTVSELQDGYPEHH